MDQIFSVLDNSFLQAFSFGIATFGLFISLRILNFPDLTIDGSFTLGAAVSGVLIVRGYPPIISILVAIIAGFCAGMLTGLFHTKLHLSKLLSGILSMMILYSLNFRIMGNTPNIQLYDKQSILSPFEKLDLNIISGKTGKEYILHIGSILFFIVILIGIKILFTRFLKTEYGVIFRAIGQNEKFVINIGISSDKLKIIGLGISNAIVSLSGGLVAQRQGFVDINMGSGMILITIAALILGEQILRMIHLNLFKLRFLTVTPIIGSFFYYLFIVVVLRLSTLNLIPYVKLQPTDLKLLTALIIIFFVYLRKGKGILPNENSL